MVKALAAALGLSTLVNVFLALTARNTALAAGKVIRQARDNADERVRVAEARYDRLLDRLSTGERLDIIPYTPSEPPQWKDVAPLSERKPYITDSPITSDAEWDELREPSD